MGDGYIKLGDIKHEVNQEIVDRLKHHTVVFYLSEPQGYRLCGSGVLVSMGDIYGILTACHVIIEWMEKSTHNRLGILLENGTTAEGIERDKMHAEKIGYIPGFEGPDIGFIVFSPEVVGTIKARKTFYDLKKNYDSLVFECTETTDGAWVCLGAIAEKTAKDAWSGRTVFRCDGLFGGPEEAGVVDGFDYLHFPDKREIDLVEYWGGMSGSGLWRLPVRGSRESGELEIMYGRPILSGIAYRQYPVDGKMWIRCHGPKSIYEKLFAHFGK